MAQTKQSIFTAAREQGLRGGIANPFKLHSWQYNAHQEGLEQGARERQADLEKGKADDALIEALGLGHIMVAQFPKRMPEPTREHIRRLQIAAMGTPDSTRALRLDSKIDKLYQRYA